MGVPEDLKQLIEKIKPYVRPEAWNIVAKLLAAQKTLDPVPLSKAKTTVLPEHSSTLTGTVTKHLGSEQRYGLEKDLGSLHYRMGDRKEAATALETYLKNPNNRQQRDLAEQLLKKARSQ